MSVNLAGIVSNSGISQVMIAQNMTVPLTYEWNLNTQYQFLTNWVLELGYVGSHGIHQPSNGGQTGSGQASAYLFNLAQLAGVGSPCVSCAATNVTTNTTANTALRTPLLGVSPTDTMVQTNLNYEYNGLQATVRKQLSRGLQFQAAYTWSRSFLQSPFGINTYPYLIDVNGPNPVYRPQRLVINYVWNLPLGHQQGLLGKLTSGMDLVRCRYLPGRAASNHHRQYRRNDLRHYCRLHLEYSTILPRHVRCQPPHFGQPDPASLGGLDHRRYRLFQRKGPRGSVCSPNGGPDQWLAQVARRSLPSAKAET